MDFAKLTQMSRSAVAEAQAIARRKSHAEVDSWHLLSALLAQESGIVPGLLEKLSLSAAAAQLAVERELDRLPKVSGAVDASRVYVTQAVNDALTRAEAEAAKLKDEFVSVEHLLLGLIDGRSPTPSGIFYAASTSTARRCSGRSRRCAARSASRPTTRRRLIRRSRSTGSTSWRRRGRASSTL